jgi:gliding motility-associated-like protein
MRMDKLPSLAIATLFGLSLSAQNAPIDFEPNGFGATWNWKVFENDYNPPLVVMQNPDTTGINPSPNVARFEALQAGQPFVGCETKHGTDIGTFTIDANNSIIRIMVYKTVVSDVGIKLVRWDNWSLGEIKVANTKTHEWEQLEFDFSAHIGLTYDQMVIFPDFTSRPADRTIYFDNVWGDLYIPPPPPPPPAPDSASMTLPNFFTPNFDGVNDRYRPLMQHADWAEWHVYNRWGQEVFNSESVTETWDGAFQGTLLSPGVYFIQAKCGSTEVGNTVEKRGVIHLLD